MGTISILTKTYVCQHVAEQWREQFRQEVEVIQSGAKYEIYQRLIALGESPAEEDIVAIIGNRSWTKMRCDLCATEVDKLAAFESDYMNDGMSSVLICQACLRSAVDQLMNFS